MRSSRTLPAPRSAAPVTTRTWMCETGSAAAAPPHRVRRNNKGQRRLDGRFGFTISLATQPRTRAPIIADLAVYPVSGARLRGELTYCALLRADGRINKAAILHHRIDVRGAAAPGGVH